MTSYNNENIDSALKGLAKFRGEQMFRHVTYQYLATHVLSFFLSKQELSKLKEIFNNIDVDKNGTLSMDELKQGYCKNMGVWISETKIVEISFYMYETDKSGFISAQELIS